MGKKLPNPSILPIPFFHSYSDSVLFQDIPIDFNAQAGGLGQGEMAFYWMNRGFSEVGAKPVFCHIAFKQWGGRNLMFSANLEWLPANVALRRDGCWCPTCAATLGHHWCLQERRFCGIR